MTVWKSDTAAQADREKVLKVINRAIEQGWPNETLAAVAGVPLSVVAALSADPSFDLEVAAEMVKAEDDGRDLGPHARRLLRKVLVQIETSLPSMDAFEAAEISKVLQRIIDAEDRRVAAARDKYADLPLINITIGSNMVRALEYGKRETIDVEDLPTVDQPERQGLNGQDHACVESLNNWAAFGSLEPLEPVEEDQEMPQ